MGYRPATKREINELGWDDGDGRPIVIDFDKGFSLVASRDEEGNGPGEFFALTKEEIFLFTYPRSQGETT